MRKGVGRWGGIRKIAWNQETNTTGGGHLRGRSVM